MRKFKIFMGFVIFVLVLVFFYIKIIKPESLDSKSISISSPEPIKLGDLHQGGVVFYLDNEQHKGLIVALTHADYDLSVGCTTKPIFNSPYGGCSWADSKALMTEAWGQELFTGEMNTKKLLQLHGIKSAFSAAYVANKYSTPEDPADVYWYLPSQAELMQIWIAACDVKEKNMLSKINKTIKDNNGLILPCSDDKSAALILPYWSSTEVAFNTTNAWNLDLGFGSVNFYSKDSSQYGVRPVRTFSY